MKYAIPVNISRNLGLCYISCWQRMAQHVTSWRIFSRSSSLRLLHQRNQFNADLCVWILYKIQLMKKNLLFSTIFIISNKKFSISIPHFLSLNALAFSFRHVHLFPSWSLLLPCAKQMDHAFLGRLMSSSPINVNTHYKRTILIGLAFWHCFIYHSYISHWNSFLLPFCQRIFVLSLHFLSNILLQDQDVPIVILRIGSDIVNKKTEDAKEYMELVK